MSLQHKPGEAAWGTYRGGSEQDCPNGFVPLKVEPFLKLSEFLVN